VSAHAATTEHPLSTGSAPESIGAPSRPVAVPARPGMIAAATLAVAGVLCFATFRAGGGLALAPMTTLEMTLTIAAGLIVAGAIVLAPARAPAYGAWPVGLALALTALTGLSVVWSVAPDSSWQDAGRMLAYSAVFAAAIAAVRVAPGGWRALLGGTVLAATVVCGYALLTKALPNHLDATDTYARLQAPYGYWNATGLTAAMGIVGCLWLGARRSGHALLSALAYPATGLMLVTLMLAYSRGALIVAVIGVALWLWLVPLRLRGARVLIVGALGAGPLVAWAFADHSLSHDNVALAARTATGHQLGVLVLAMLVLLTLAGVAIGFFGGRRAPSMRARRNAGAVLIALLVLALIVVAAGLAASRRGFTGTISHDVSSLTDPNAPVPPNTPGRLTAIASVRARYWKEALEVFQAHPALGAGASGYETARLRYRKETLDVKHAHGYVVQTLADLGIVGLATTLALLAAWMAAAGRATRPLNRRWVARLKPLSIRWAHSPAEYTPERIGMLTMLCVVVVFGVHSLADWTWYVPGDALVALLCAGWLAGRGPLPTAHTASAAVAHEETGGGPAASDGRAASAPPRRLPRSWGELGTARTAVAGAVLAGALLAAWTQWQPQRSVNASEQALALFGRHPAAASAAAQAAVSRDPLSAQALLTRSAVEHARGESGLARSTLQQAVRLQPGNPQTWLALGQYDMTADPSAAASELRAAVYLDPESIPTQNAYVEALRAMTARVEAQNRLRRAATSRSRRAPGRPPARRTRTSSKPKSASRPASARRV
jgi:O-Antigen ligase